MERAAKGPKGRRACSWRCRAQGGFRSPAVGAELVRFHQETQNETQFKTHELCIAAIFHLVLPHWLPPGLGTTESTAADKGGRDGLPLALPAPRLSGPPLQAPAALCSLCPAAELLLSCRALP